MADDSLKAALIELVRAASARGLSLFLGGGYGLYLKQVHLTLQGTRTFLPVDAWPKPRGTPDLDIFLPTELVVDLGHMVQFREVLTELKYEPVAKFMHFEKRVEQGKVRVELLTGPIDAEFHDKMHFKLPRVRPKGNVEIHAYLHEEALALEIEPLTLPLSGNTTVRIPNAFSFLLMKLHAARDRLDDDNKQLGRHHALDVYRIIAMMSEAEVDLVRRLRQEHRDHDVVRSAIEISAVHFADLTSRGVVRMREHTLASADLKIEQALELLRDLLHDASV